MECGREEDSFGGANLQELIVCSSPTGNSMPANGGARVARFAGEVGLAKEVTQGNWGHRQFGGVRLICPGLPQILEDLFGHTRPRFSQQFRESLQVLPNTR